jgi:hypothetical protein
VKLQLTTRLNFSGLANRFPFVKFRLTVATPAFHTRSLVSDPGSSNNVSNLPTDELGADRRGRGGTGSDNGVETMYVGGKGSSLGVEGIGALARKHLRLNSKNSRPTQSS